MKHYSFFLLLFSITIMACYGSKNIGKEAKSTPKIQPAIHFIENSEMDLMSVVDKAEKLEKLVYVAFGADWCLPCQLMDEEVYNRPEVYSYFNENFINYKVDIEATNGQNLKLLYQIEDLPTLLFLDHKGKIIVRNNGTAMSSKLLRLANEVVIRKNSAQ